MNQTSKKPALNISAFYIPPYMTDYYRFYGNTWTDPRTNQSPYANSSNRALMARSGNTTYSLAYIEENGSCQAVGVSQ
jgi:hypothetical protein